MNYKVNLYIYCDSRVIFILRHSYAENFFWIQTTCIQTIYLLFVLMLKTLKFLNKYIFPTILIWKYSNFSVPVLFQKRHMYIRKCVYRKYDKLCDSFQQWQTIRFWFQNEFNYMWEFCQFWFWKSWRQATNGNSNNIGDKKLFSQRKSCTKSYYTPMINFSANWTWMNWKCFRKFCCALVYGKSMIEFIHKLNNQLFRKFLLWLLTEKKERKKKNQEKKFYVSIHSFIQATIRRMIFSKSFFWYL